MMQTLSTQQKLEAAKVFKAGGKDWREFSLGQAMLKDGGSPMVYDGEQLVQGMPVFVETETEAGFEPYPDGTYELEDGTIVEVFEGIAKSVTAPAAPTEDEPQAQDKTLTPEQESAIKRIVETHSKETIYEEVKKTFSDYVQKNEDAIKAEVDKQVAEVKTSYEAKMAEHEKSVNELTKIAGELIEMLKKAPSSTPAVKPTTTFNSNDEKLEEADARYQRVLELRKKQK